MGQDDSAGQPPEGPWEDNATLEVGRVVRPHGLAGLVVAELVTNRTERLTAGSMLNVGRRRLRVTSAGSYGTAARGGRHGPVLRFLVRFEGVDSREEAEALRGEPLLAMPIEDPGALWAHELIGSIVAEADGREHGLVVALEANPASDLLVLEGGGLVPLRFVVSTAPGRVVVDPPPGLLEE